MRELLSALPSAEVRGSTFVAWGDDGGQIYLTVPARRIASSAEDLAQLVCDIDWLHWHQADAIGIRFVDPVSGGVAGGMGGGKVTDALWVHDVMAGSALADRIAQVIAGQRHSIWPSGSTSTG
ncbi:MAG: hypothetical protein JO103_06675, partial [Candidatus Eremiobacteraeota bacterium]|nr:hypothetical protein [Candidatus Eremiobacteraeota bacterium]